MGPCKSAKLHGCEAPKASPSGATPGASNRPQGPPPRRLVGTDEFAGVVVALPLIGQRTFSTSKSVDAFRHLRYGSNADDQLVNFWAGKVAHYFAYHSSSWAKLIPLAKKKINGDAELLKAFKEEAEKSTLITADMLKQVCAMESGGNRGAENGSYYGLFQMGDSAASAVGIPLEDIQGEENWRKNVEAGRKYLEKHAEHLTKEGCECTTCNIYLLHQQGPTGGLKVLRQVESGESQWTPSPKNQKTNMYGYYTGKAKKQLEYKTAVRDALGTAFGRKLTTSLEPSVEEYYRYLSGIWDMIEDVFSA